MNGLDFIGKLESPVCFEMACTYICVLCVCVCIFHHQTKSLVTQEQIKPGESAAHSSNTVRGQPSQVSLMQDCDYKWKKTAHSFVIFMVIKTILPTCSAVPRFHYDLLN